VNGRPPPGAHTSTGDRYGNHSTILTSQLPSESWHDHVGEPTIADAISDRLLHNAHKVNLEGDSRRKDEKTRSQWLTRVAPFRSRSPESVFTIDRNNRHDHRNAQSQGLLTGTAESQ